jgi:hypothetical protein
MGATNISTIIAKENTANVFQQIKETRVYDINVLDPAFTGITTVATHNLIPIAAGEVILGAKMVILTTFTSASNNGTIVFQFPAGAAVSAAFTADGTELAAGDVITFGNNDLEDTAGLGLYTAAADTLDMTVGTNALTAGRFLLILDVANVNDITGNSL